MKALICFKGLYSYLLAYLGKSNNIVVKSTGFGAKPPASISQLYHAMMV